MIGSPNAQPRAAPALGLGGRIAIILAIFLADKVFLNRFVDFDLAQAAEGFGAVVRHLQHWGFRFLAALAAALIVFAYVRGGRRLELAAAAMRALPIRISRLALHCVFLGVLVPLTYALFHRNAGPFSLEWVVALWMAVGSGAAAALILAFAPAPLWMGIARSLGRIWLYAALAALVGSAAMQLSQMLWAPAAGVTFSAVAYLLRGFIPNLHADAATRVLSSEHFSVLVSDVCSGLEGVGLILAFLVSWLVYFRGEYRFPRALLLIPLGLLCIFVLNILRIAALMLIGNLGYAEVAIYGFHSQAGWISFIGVACGMAYASRNSAWLSHRAPLPADSRANATNPTAVYLLPLLTILAAGAISHALSGKFETFYPLRLMASIMVLWLLRRHLRAMAWQWRWPALAVGFGLFALWWVAAHLLLPAAPIPEALAAMPPWGRWVWVASRVLGAVATVPLAEELAYRGYLMRRLQGEDFERTSYAAVRGFALGLSSVLFGVMHGPMWLPGTLAGLAYGFLAKRSGGLGESVLAHAVTNALLAACVLGLADWRLW